MNETNDRMNEQCCIGQGQTKASRLMMLQRSHQRRLRSVIAVNNERPLRSFIISGLVVLWLNTRLLVRWVRGSISQSPEHI